MPGAPAKPPGLFQRIATWAKDAVDWIGATFGDPEIAAQVRGDLGLDTTDPATPPTVDDAHRAKIEQFAAKQDVDTATLAQTATQVVGLVDTVRTFADAVAADGVDPWDVVQLLFKVWTVESLRLRNPSAFALCQLVGLVTADEETVEQIDPEPLLRTLRGSGTPDDTDAWVDRISALVGALLVVFDAASATIGGTIDASYGWDPNPGAAPDAADAAARTLTVLFHVPAWGDVRPALTLVGVPRHHGGPGVLLSLSAHVAHSETIEGTKVTLDAGANGAFSLYVPLGKSSPRVLGGVNPSVALTIEPDPAAGRPRPALVIGTSDATRLEIGSVGFGVSLDAGAAGLRLLAHKGKLVVSLGDGDGFLRRLPGGTVEVPFDLGLLADTAHGVRIDGGTGLKVNLPVSASVFGVFVIQYVELELTLDDHPAVHLHGGFSLHLGPFQASVDRIGLVLDLAAVWGEGRPLDELVRFAPPRGIGLVLDAGVVKGGGYLFIDAERGEYAGALELKLAMFSIKAIAIITTKRPDGSDGWSLLVVVYGQFVVHIAFGIFLTGVGGLIGLHHRADVDALSAGMRTGALDDILFPDNPVADAPRIINRYRALFPVEQDTLLLGPMLQLSFSEPPIVYISLGLIFEVQNALGGDGPVKLSKVILIGQLLVQLPPKETKVPAILKLLVDVVGFYDAEQQFLMIRARLRDSFVGIEGFAKLDLSGELLLAMRFGGDPSFVLSAGGFHPAFKDVPAGVPAVLDRLAVSFSVGIIKMRAEQYFAVTSNSVQAGFKIEIKADIDVASIEGWLAFDALLYLTPVFHFLVTVDFHVAVRAFGTNLAAVHVHLALEGPGEWHAVGSFTFTVLWHDIDIGFDERWGSAPQVAAATTSGAQAIVAEFSAPGALEPGPPVGGSALVTLAAVTDGTKPAHPLGRLAVRQTALPLDVRIDRIGTDLLAEGPTTFSVTSVTVGTQPATATERMTDHFARGQYMELSEQDKLDGHSFERFTSGVAVGTEAYLVPGPGRAVDAAYERKILEPEQRLHLHWGVVLPDNGRLHLLAFEVADALTPLGAAARSARGREAQLRAAAVGAAAVTTPRLSVVDAATLAPVASLTDAVAGSPAAAGQIAREAGARVVEAYEVPA